MNKKTEQFPVLPAASWSWTTVEAAIEEYIEERFDVRGTLDGDYRSGGDRVKDADLMVRKQAHLDTVSTYHEEAVTFILDVQYDPLQGDSLEFKQLSVRLEEC